VNCINELKNENEELEFIKVLRELMWLKNTLTIFSDFSFEHLEMNEQLFEYYKSKYLDLINDDKPTLLERKKVSERILSKIRGFFETFISGRSGN